MIHAYLFVTHNYFDRDDHGEQFQKHMNRINKAAKSHITVYHTFHDEVDYCRKWWWRCDGRCRSKPPYYGYVKRAVNRPPQAADWWFAKHQQECGGKFHLVKSPEKRIDTLFSKQWVCFVEYAFFFDSGSGSGSGSRYLCDSTSCNVKTN